MKAAPTITTPPAYLAVLADDRKKALTAVHRAIRKTDPGLKPGIHHGMIGYGIGPYRTKSGRKGEWFKVGLASNKNYMSLYICACDPQSGYIAENNKDRLGKVSVGKSCIRFKKLEDLDLEVAMELVAAAAAGEIVA